MTTTIDNSPTSATLETMADNRTRYGRYWRGVPRDLGFLLLTMPIASVGFGLTIGLVSGGTASLVTFFIGIFLLAGALYVSRGFGTVELVRLDWTGRAPIARPEWPVQPGFWGWARSLFGNGHYWLYLLHTALINFIVSLVTWTITITWLAIGLGGTSYWFWGGFIPEGRSPWFVSRWLAWVFGGVSGESSGVDWRMLDNLIQLVLGLAFLAALPFVTRALVNLHHLIARGVLGAFASDALRREVTSLSASRGAAVAAEGHSLRRLERDIHDGPQQRLVRLQMDLASAERELDRDPDAARARIAEATEQSKAALEELRALSRGFAPPILLDRGLLAALESLAVRNPVPVTITSVTTGTPLPAEVERNAYFIVSELVTNATKHAEATAIGVQLSTRDEGGETWLEVTVGDNGRGGAASVEGHGLAGLEERTHGLGGTLTIDSPDGGPTTVTARIPLAA